MVGGGPHQNPSTQEILDALRAAGAERAVVLPNDPNVRGVADAAAGLWREEGHTVAVIPTKSPVQGIAALAVHDPDRPFDDDVIAMTAAAGATRWASVTVAVRAAHTSVGVCGAGDALGMIEGDVAVIAGSVEEAAAGVLDRMLIGGGELVTLVAGEDAAPDLVRRLTEYVLATRPALEVLPYDGGQPYYPLLVGVE